MVKGHGNKFYVHDTFTVDELTKKRATLSKPATREDPLANPAKALPVKNMLHDI